MVPARKDAFGYPGVSVKIENRNWKIEIRNPNLGYERIPPP